MTRVIPPKPEKNTTDGWIEWVQTHYPYDPRRKAMQATRSPRDVPTFGTVESLDDLRAIPRHDATSVTLAAYCAWHWYNTSENMERILKYHAAKRREEEERERKRLILLANRALDNKLGESAQEKDDARETAQAYLRKAPELCSTDELEDWLKMHQYAKRLARGWQGPKPKLAADLRREAEQRRAMNDIDDAIGAVPANRNGYEQRGLYG